MYLVKLFFFFVLLLPMAVSAQEEHDDACVQGHKYVSCRIRSLDKHNSRISRQQDRLLKKLKRKEGKYANRLQKRDSFAYANYLKQPVSFDSIGKIANNDSARIPSASTRKNISIDKAKSVAAFVEAKTGFPTPELKVQNAQLSALQGQLAKRDLINSLISERAATLNKIPGSALGKPASLTGMQKNIYYGNERMKVFKDMEEEPEKAEDEAWEFLQGSKGFKEHLAGSTAGTANNTSILAAKGADASVLEAMGYQTKRTTQTHLQNKMGGGMNKAGASLGTDLGKWQKKQNETLSTIKQTRTSVKNAAGTATKPPFKVNAMRGLPFRKRISAQYAINTSRTDGTKPAIAEPAVTIGFKHTTALNYGIGAGLPIGLGTSFQDIHFSLQGIAARNYLTWELLFGVAAYGGYERMYNTIIFGAKYASAAGEYSSSTKHVKDTYSESLLLGLTKKYTINSKYNGSIQVLYDIWWQQKGMNTPVIIRFATSKK